MKNILKKLTNNDCFTAVCLVYICLGAARKWLFSASHLANRVYDILSFLMATYTLVYIFTKLLNRLMKKK